MDDIRILQLGTEDWEKIYQVPDYAKIEYIEPNSDALHKLASGKPFDMVFLDRTPSKEELADLHKLTKAYTMYVTEKVERNRDIDYFYACKKGKNLATPDIQNFLTMEVRNYFPKPYGEKFRLKNLAITQGFDGNVKWNGNYEVVIKGNYGPEWKQVAYFRNSIPIFAGQAIDFWFEYRRGINVSVKLVITQFVQGSLSDIQNRWEFSGEELKHIMTVDNQLGSGPVFVSIFAKGEGELHIIALHDRHSRRGHGYFLPGGDRYISPTGEEVFCYFDPGDMKPPLNVYFSGYKTMEGFEGYNMLRKMGCPFLLIAEARMEGGNFYMGGQKYESIIPAVIRKCMRELQFTNEQVIMSGLSMGTYGALYYGCDIQPHAMILGKPLASIGNVAQNERLLRPGVFPTSVDVLRYLCGDTGKREVARLNQRFWEKFDKTDWRKSKFIISYMIEDDYDEDAYKMLIAHLHSDGVQVYGKGLHGKHNDNTGGIVGWFTGQYDKILSEDFARRIEH